MEDQKEAPLSGLGFFVRLYWMFVGNALLMFLLGFIYSKHSKFPSLLDAAYLGALASLILVRYVEIQFLNGQTGEGKPATLAHWRRYAKIVAPAGVVGWFFTPCAGIPPEVGGTLPQHADEKRHAFLQALCDLRWLGCNKAAPVHKS